MAWDERNDGALRVHELRLNNRDHHRQLLPTIVEPLAGRKVERVGLPALLAAEAEFIARNGAAVA